MSDKEAHAAALAAVLSRAQRADFVTLVRLLERLTQSAPLGMEAAPWEERIRLRHSTSLAFAPSDVERANTAGDAVELTTAFLGLGGTTAALPLQMAEEMAQEGPERPVRQLFTDLFHHRALSLLYRSLARMRLANELEGDAEDAWSRRLRALAGDLGAGALAPDLVMELLPVRCGRRTASGFRAALRHVVRRELGPDVDVEVREFSSGRVELPTADRIRLRRQRNALGRETTLGRSVLDAGSGVTVVVQPLDGEAHQRLLPGGDLHAHVCGVFRMFDRNLSQLQLELHVEGAVRSAVGRGARLRRDVWLARGGAARVVRVTADVDDASDAA